MLRQRAWRLTLLLAALLAGCGTSAETPTVAAPTTTISARPSATGALSSPTPQVRPSASPTIRPRPAPSLTLSPQADLKLAFTDCTWKFCPPDELDLMAMNAAQRPGILKVEFVDEFNVCLVYDPTHLTQEEVIRVFERSTSLNVSEVIR
jgi:hypothetical protein